MTQAVAHAREVHLRLQEFGIDNDGEFPSGGENSNAAFRQLFDRKFQGERQFFVHGSAWHNTLPSGRLMPDGVVGDPPNYDRALERGENHWAYVSQLNSDSKGNLPIVMDGFSDVPGVYSDNSEERGGVWEGVRAVVVRVDGSSKLAAYGDDLRVYEKVDGMEVDIFSKEYGTESANLLNPW
ncbi:MAG: hypothetical protein KDN22_21215 [Verrucomicrobiae bacterium]|nr:hypothetical protein [Verrucomicrobiae bacterium]